MSKQIKIGLDKVPAPVTKQFSQLVDIEGTLLFDAAGNPLVTEEEAALVQFTNKESALSVSMNNQPLDGGSLRIEEQFPDTSAVSSSLLGVPRSEEQLSLFSDVASYGLDEDQWDFNLFTDNTHPYEWYRKKNPVHGRRFNSSFIEGSNEQALYLTAFPSQYTYPRGPREQRSTTPTDAFIKYMNFIAMGRYLYESFKGANRDFAEKHFLSETDASIVNQGGTVASIIFLTQGDPVFDGDGSFFDVNYGQAVLQDSFDAIERWTVFSDRIRNGEAVFPPVAGGNSDFTNPGGAYPKIQSFLGLNCTPGGVSTYRQIGILQSKRAFRYQPGRASGFTFGTRMTGDPISTGSILEWGCSNETDEYMFQLRGSQLNIVRRSTIKMPDDLLIRQGLRTTDQSSVPVYAKGIGNSTPLWETVIGRSKFNGDALLGAGESGYILSFEDVTMYKIEFSWYGAIGAKFYAYIPSGNGEARWALMHTLVIENGLGKPILNNPDFKFKYLCYSGNNATLSQPMNMYKYGSSYYVDGGDEGTITVSSTSTQSKNFTTNTAILGVQPKQFITNSDGTEIRNAKKAYISEVSVSTNKNCRVDLVEIEGSPDGVHHAFTPSLHMNGRHPRSRSLNFNVTSPNILTVEQPASNTVSGTIAVSNGSTAVSGGTAFTTELVIGDNLSIGGTDYQIDSITDNANLVLSVPYNGGSAFSGTVTLVKRINPDDDNAHLIANGIYGSYLNSSYDSTGRTSNILRRGGKYLLTSQDMRDYMTSNGAVIDIGGNPSFTAILSKQETVVASTVPIQSNEFKIHFLIPQPRDPQVSGSHWGRPDLGSHLADFSVGVVPYYPVEPGGDGDTDRLQFNHGTSSAPDYKFLTVKDHVFGEYTHRRTEYSASQRAERREWEPGYVEALEVDPRFSQPPGNDRGYVAAIKGRVRNISYEVLSTNAVTPADGIGQFGLFDKLTFATGESGPSDTIIKFDAQGNPMTEVGINFSGTGKYYRSTVQTPENGNKFIYVDSVADDSGAGTTSLQTDIDALTSVGIVPKVQSKSLTLTDDFQAKSYNDSGEETFTDNQFTKSVGLSFNSQPLYPVFLMGDHAKINNIIVEEIFSDGSSSCHNPVFVRDTETYNPALDIIGSGNSTQALMPGSFNSSDRLSSLKYDQSVLQPLRPGTVINSFYVEADKPTRINLENIYRQDRRGLTRGLTNQKATYFVATSLDTSQGSIEMTVTTKEQ